MTHHSPPRKPLKFSIFIPAVFLFCLLTALFAWADTVTVNYGYDNTYQVKHADFGNGSVVDYTYDDAVKKLHNLPNWFIIT